MTEQRHKTVLEIAVDDRGLRQIHNTIRQVFSVTSVAAYNKEVERVTQTVGRLTQRMGGAGPGRLAGAVAAGGRPTMVGVPGGMPPRAGGGGGGAGAAPTAGEPPWVAKLIAAVQGGRQPMGFAGTAAATGVGVAGANMLGRLGGVGAGAAHGEGFSERMLGAIPGVGPILAAAVGSARQFASEFQSYRQGLAGVQGAIGMGSIPANRRRALSQVGIGPEELPGRFAEIGGASGMRGRDLSDFASRALVHERITGAGAGQQAALVGAGGMGEVTTNADIAQRLIAKAIETGMAGGFRDAKFGDMMASIAGHVAALREKGIMTDPRSTLQLVAMLGATRRTGLMGEPGLAAAKTMEGVVRAAPDKSDFFSAILMQLAMKKKGSPFKGMMELEQNPAAMIPEVLKRITQMGGSEEGQAFALHQGMGGQISRLQAMQMIQASKAGEVSPEQVEKILNQFQTARMNPETGKMEMLKGREARTATMYEEAGGRQGFGVAAQAAQMEQQRLDTGAKHIGVMQKLQSAELKLADEGARLGAQMSELTTAIIPYATKGLAAFTDTLGAVGNAVVVAVKKIDSVLKHLAETEQHMNPTGDSGIAASVPSGL